MTDFVVIIPARLNSTRLDKKLLQLIADKPLLYYTYLNAINSKAKEVIIATDSQQIVDVMSKFGASCVLTSTNHTSGTSRIAEVIKLKNINKNQIIVNLQGDEPLLLPAVIEQVANNLSKQVSTATICENIKNEQDYFDKNCVKVVFNNNNLALYFSRSPIPAFREIKIDLSVCFKHIGIYAYRAEFVEKYLNLTMSSYEKAEKLEQLSILTNGYNIHIEEACTPTGIGVDTQDDLVELRKIFNDN